MAEYQICQRCIMDTSDPNIGFDKNGVCDYCQHFDSQIKPDWNFGRGHEDALKALSTVIKSDGIENDYDCIIGLSGGLDSSYAAHIAVKTMGLRPLLIHVDAGWNTDQAVSNIEALINGLDLELYTEVVDWQSVRRMQLAFLKSGIADQDLVQDAAFFSSLYKFARQHKVKHVITGSNFSTECCREPEEWGGYLGIDRLLFNDVWNKYGDGQPISFPLIDILKYKILYQKLLGMKIHHPLNMVRFSKSAAEATLENEYGWRKFQHKHHESRFTRFFEDYWLPKRFGYEKRRAHFSSLIQTGQISRDKALERIMHPEMSDSFWARELEYIASKLGVTVGELDELLCSEKKTFHNYKNKRKLIQFGTKILRHFGKEKRFFR